MIKKPTTTITIIREVEANPNDWRDGEKVTVTETIDDVMVQDISDSDIERFGDIIGNYSLKIFLPRDFPIDGTYMDAKCTVGASVFTVHFVSQNKDFFMSQRYKYTQFIIVGDQSVQK